MNSKNQLYLDPFDEFDPHHRITGRKAFTNDVRCLQSKINLKFRDESPRKSKPREAISVNRKFIDEFDRKYKEMCDNKKMGVKHRGISIKNPF